MKATLESLQRLFDEPIEEVRPLDPGYTDHASDVWLVRMASQEVVVRSSRLQAEPEREFWWGCKHLFGIDPRDMLYFEANLKVLHPIPEVAAPRVISRAKLDGRDYLLVQRMKGTGLQSFQGQPNVLLYQFGVWLAQVHSNTYEFYGNLAGTKLGEKKNFYHDLSQAMKDIVEKEHSASSHIQRSLESILVELAELLVPEHFCPVLVDMDPSQFLTDHGRISAIVDCEAYVVAPREFDFIGLEYILDRNAADAFIQGYTTILALPALDKVRRVYRYWYRLLGVQGSVDLDQWFAQPELFK